MKARRSAMRFGPWLAMVIVVAAALALPAIEGAGLGAGTDTVRRGALLATPVPTPSLSATDCATLASLSEEAAALTGSLALVELDERPSHALWAAGRVRALAAKARGTEGGSELAMVLADLAEALESYAGGDPSALAGVRGTSTRNAQLRSSYQTCNGGTP